MTSRSLRFYTLLIALAFIKIEAAKGDISLDAVTDLMTQRATASMPHPSFLKSPDDTMLPRMPT